MKMNIFREKGDGDMLNEYTLKKIPQKDPHKPPGKKLDFCSFWSTVNCMSLVMRKRAFCICENKDADQLRGNREADQRLCFRYTDSAIPLLPKYEISRV